MKKTIYLAFALAVLAACRPDPYESIGPAYSTVEGINGSWAIDKVVVVDELSPLKLTRDMSDFYTMGPAAQFRVTFDVAARTYSTVNGDAGGVFFGNSGQIAFDDDEFPRQLYLIEDGDTLTFNFLRLTRAIDPTLALGLKRNACESDYMQYQYNLIRQ